MKLLVVVLLLVALSLGDKQLEETAEENYRRCQEQPCRVPQERVLSARWDLLRRGMIQPRHTVIPERVVLHRCVRSGCCPDVHRPCCSSVADVNVSLPFNLMDKVGNSYELGRTFIFVNHTACECTGLA